MPDHGVFCISLDFELHWGCIENMKVLDSSAETYFTNTRKAIPQMLEIFKSGDIHVTWAAVGMLFRKNKTEWEQHQPGLIPAYTNKDVSSYEWIKSNGFSREDDPYHFAPDLIDLIRSVPNQEIGTHTYSHYFCLEPGQNKEQFREDLRMAVTVAKEKGIDIRSLVFPRNQFNEEYLSVCREFGITSVRTSPDIWYWAYSIHAGGFWKRFFRAGDAYIKMQPISMVFLDQIDKNKSPLHLPASRLYRPWRPKYSLENKLKMRRILNEMTDAAKKGGYYHIWWHPHNFGRHPEECLAELRQIVDHFGMLQKKYGFESLTMHEITQRITGTNH